MDAIGSEAGGALPPEAMQTKDTMTLDEAPVKPENRYIGDLAGWSLILASRDSDDFYSYKAGQLIIARWGVVFYARRPGLLALSYALRLLRNESCGGAHQSESLQLRRQFEAPVLLALFENKGSKFDFPHWNIEKYVKLAAACKLATVHVPHDENRFSSYEDWLERSIGEYLLYSMPELWPQILLDMKDHIAFLFEEGRKRVYDNVIPPQPGSAEPWTHFAMEPLK